MDREYPLCTGKWSISDYTGKINQFADGPDAKTDGIASADEFDTAYAQGISDTQMDYCINGMGEVLNKNMVPIGALLEPTDAARQLLNLSSDKKLVSVEKNLNLQIKHRSVYRLHF